MTVVLKLLCGAALAVTVLPSVMFLAGSMDLDTAKRAMLGGTILWFVMAPLAERQTAGEKMIEETGNVPVP